MKKHNPYKLTIEKIENGFLLTHNEQLDDDWVKERKEAIIEDDDEEKEIVAVLQQVAEYFGIYNSKHKERNLEIGFKKN